ncbi:phasin family protein [Ramlibacter sp. AW1]|uniref:Phasin family protein n=1 Tax=Ramlibacter aurantiacus TaxID=2801330 RepID=A0A936ZK72_9BURK|nr:phasin family protein [Ramlibacter aurantiacus]
MTIDPTPASLTPAPTWLPWADAGRQQAVVANEWLVALCSGFGAMRSVQQDAARQAAERHAQAVQRLQATRDAAELATIQSELLKMDAEGVLRYWQDLGATAAETQSRLMACCFRMVDSTALLESASAIDTVTDNLLPAERVARPRRSAPRR